MKSFRDGIIRLFRAAGGRLSWVAQRLELGARASAFDQWVRDRGDLNKRLDYALEPSAVVWDVGGYEGQWASDIYSRFGCYVEVFEPAPHACSFIRRRFSANPRVRVHPYALGVEECSERLSLAGDASSLETACCGADTQTVVVRDVVAVMKEMGGGIDLMKLNIEGSEYSLIERLVTSGLIGEVRELQVQFHDFVPNAQSRRGHLLKSLARTHEQTWCYEFVWENWKRRPAHRQ